MFILKLFESLRGVREMSADTYKSAEKMLNKKRQQTGGMHGAVANIPGSKDVTSRLSTHYAKLGVRADRFNQRVQQGVKAGIEKHRPKIMGGNPMPSVGAAPKKPGAAAPKQAIRTPSTTPRVSTYKPTTAAPAPTKRASNGSWGRTAVGTAIAGAGAYGAYRLGKSIYNKYEQWKSGMNESRLAEASMSQPRYRYRARAAAGGAALCHGAKKFGKKTTESTPLREMIKVGGLRDKPSWRQRLKDRVASSRRAPHLRDHHIRQRGASDPTMRMLHRYRGNQSDRSTSSSSDFEVNRFRYGARNASQRRVGSRRRAELRSPGKVGSVCK